MMLSDSDKKWLTNFYKSIERSPLNDDLKVTLLHQLICIRNRALGRRGIPQEAVQLKQEFEAEIDKVKRPGRGEAWIERQQRAPEDNELASLMEGTGIYDKGKGKVKATTTTTTTKSKSVFDDLALAWKGSPHNPFEEEK